MSDTKKIYEKLGRANRVMEDLIDIAVRDKNISEEEKKILFSINKNLEQYARLIIESISDNKITDEEKEDIAMLEQKIIDDANNIALNDENLSDDEKKLLYRLIDTIGSGNE